MFLEADDDMERYLHKLWNDPTLALETDELEKIHGARKIFRLVWDFYYEICGGFAHYLEVTSGFNASRCLKALVIIGASSEAVFLASALSLVASEDYIYFTVPWDDYGERVKKSLLLENEINLSLRILDEQFEEASQYLIPALFSFAVAQGDGFKDFEKKTYKRF